MQRTLSLFASAALVSVAAAQAPRWTQAAPTNPPSARRAGAMAFDALSTPNRLILFGGITQTPSAALNETWSYAPATDTWTLLAPAPTPSPRWGHQLVRMTPSNRLMMFGGRSPTISGLANDTVEWNGTTWTPMTTTGAPQQRFRYGMAFDSTRGVAVLFGGRGYTQTYGDTWEYVSTPTPTWTLRTTANAPSPREDMAMVYDAVQQRVVLFGGYDTDTDTIYGDTWFFDGTDWVDATPSDPGQSPTPRYRTQSHYDSVRQRIVSFGGYTGTEISTQTWEFTGQAWQQITMTTALEPPNATEAYHAFDPNARRTVVFGGYGLTGFSNSTYEYEGVTSGVFTTFGEPCNSLAPAPGLTSNTPRIGNPWMTTCSNVPATAELVTFAIGFSNTVWNAVPLPVSLAALNLPDCNLRISPDVLAFVANVGGSGTYNLAIPNQASVVGTTLYVQAFPTDAFPALQVLGATAGGRALIGS